MIIFPSPCFTRGRSHDTSEYGNSRSQGPDAAPQASGPAPGTPGRVGAVACGRAAWRDSRRPKPRRSGRPAVGHQWRIPSLSVLQGRRGASLKHRARDAGGNGGLAVLLPERPRCREASRSAGPSQVLRFRPPVSRAPSDFLSSRTVTDFCETIGGRALKCQNPGRRSVGFDGAIRGGHTRGHARSGADGRTQAAPVLPKRRESGAPVRLRGRGGTFPGTRTELFFTEHAGIAHRACRRRMGTPMHARR